MAPSAEQMAPMAEQLAGFSVVDYVVFVGLLVISMGIGVFHGVRGNKNPEEFLLGGRSMATLPVSISLLSSFISAISILGNSGETYAHGMQLSMLLVGALTGITGAAHLFLPVFYPLKMTSVNEYIEMRFNSRLLRITALVLNTFIGLIYSGLCLFAPTLALASVTPLSVDSNIVILGIVCTVYSTIGGLKAVVWTDVFQMGVVTMGVVAVIIVGCLEVGGFQQVWAIAQANNRTEFFDLSLSLHQRHTMANVITMGTVLIFCVPAGPCRPTSAKIKASSLRRARVLYINIVGMIVLCGLLYFSGLCAFATYHGCDPLTRGLISTKDQIMPYFVMDKMGFLYGMPGLFVATLFSGALSSLSSVINSLVAMLWTDVLEPLPWFGKMSKAGGAVVNKLLSLVVGALMIGVAFFAKRFGGLIQAAITITGVMGGPMLGLFILGILVPHCDRRGAFVGLVVSAVFVSWIAMGASFYGTKPEYLSLSADNCPVSFNVSNQTLNSQDDQLMSDVTQFANLSAFVQSRGQNDLDDVMAKSGLHELVPEEEAAGTTVAESLVEEMGAQQQEEEDWPLLALYKISYTLYPVIGTLTCIIVAIIITIATGGEDLSQVRPELVSPIIRRFLPARSATMKDAYYLPVKTFSMEDSANGHQLYPIRKSEP
ncbi:sodium-coupled monocarboxylate transporter 1-like [Penaeus japonicus]|uniref:sodium-coupled monocarboxylate transporter 1-like n=1 Tax=Penaeus japonicus TaxID=27405 RepID=UPI001C710CC0|nr:sodium-coupled monocarboxylate transporter 1-like [Penaeus japonicus]